MLRRFLLGLFEGLVIGLALGVGAARWLGLSAPGTGVAVLLGAFSTYTELTDRVKKKATDDEMFKVIRNGKPPMPAYNTKQLTDEQIKTLIVYIRSLSK